jgi:hypothetical protein
MSGVKKDEGGVLPEGHPIHTLMEEHSMILDFASKLLVLAESMKKARGAGTVEKLQERLDHLADHFKESARHYEREENVLFPHLEKHGITGPPAQMWTEHNEIRDVKKRLYALADTEKPASLAAFQQELWEVSSKLSEKLQMHFHKENTVLFPMSLRVVGKTEWDTIVEECDEIGYTIFTPVNARGRAPVKGDAPGAAVAKRKITLETGGFSADELETILDTLPVDITFVGEGDEVRYFSNSRDRIFPRTKAIIGRNVQNCHPEKSVHVVQKILDDFRAGRRDSAEFWINMGPRMINIRYFALRRKGKYIGTLEVSQDIAPLRKLQGEKRLLD